MSGLAGDFEDEVVGQGDAWLGPVPHERRGDHIRILEGEVLMIQQHLDRRCDRGRAQLIDGGENPHRLHEHDVADPGASRDERLCRGNLPRIVTGDKANEDIRVNRAHGASSCIAGSPP